jgi:hypothetical protein
VINFTRLPDDSKVSKLATNLNFSIKATAPNPTDQNLTTEFYLDTGAGYKKINSFTANGTAINNGKLTATSGTEYAITVNKTSLVPNSVNSFKLKAVTTDSGGLQGEKAVTLTHYNAPSVINFYNPADGQLLSDGQSVRKSNNTWEFGLKVTKTDLPQDALLETELYIGINGVYQKVNEFTVNGVLNETGKILAQNQIGYTLSFNKALYVPLYANDFKLKAVVKDSLGEQTIKEISLTHFTDILAQWSLDSIKERVAVDSGGQSNNGIIHGAALTTGIISNAFKFDGVDDYVEIPLTPSLTITTGSFSVEAWVKTTDVPLANDGIVGNYRTTTIPYWALSHLGDAAADRGKFCFGLRDEKAVAGIIKTAMPLNDGKWHHLVGVRDAAQGKMRFYVDGALVGEVVAPSGNVNSGQSIWLGETLNRYFKGSIDEVTLYSCALTAEEVLQNYQKICFLEKVKITNQYNEEATARITYGTHLSKIEFDLKKTINKLTLELDLPSSIKIARIENVYYKAEGAAEVKLENPLVSIVDGNKITIEQTLATGHYKIEMILNISEKLIVKTKAYSDELAINTNHESEEYLLHYMDLKELPNVT